LSGTSFNKNIESLNPLTDYYVKAYITIKDVIIYSEQTKITTTDGWHLPSDAEWTDFF